MFDIAMVFMADMVDLIIPIITIYILFDLMGSLMFGKR